MTFSGKVILFYESLKIEVGLPKSCEVLNPYKLPEVKKAVGRFYSDYYADQQKRIFIFGINPGRFGAGMTGIPFTDPVRLSEVCGLEHNFPMKPELSSIYIHHIIGLYGGISKFCNDFFLTAVCPLGFILNGKNMNYYDDKKLQSALHGFIVKSMRKQIDFGTTNQVCICLGEGKNYEYFSALNEKEHFFSTIIPLPHPRWVMQYRRKSMDKYAGIFIQTLKEQRQLMADIF